MDPNSTLFSGQIFVTELTRHFEVVQKPAKLHKISKDEDENQP